MDDCQLPPPGWRCTRAPGHSGPCAAVPDERGLDKGTHRRMGCILIVVITAIAWLVIFAALVWLASEPVKVRDPRTACERSNLPWSIAERCR